MPFSRDSFQSRDWICISYVSCIGKNVLYCHLGSPINTLLLLLLLSCFSRVRLCDSIHGSPSGSTFPGILQARTLEWVAISFSNAWKWKVKVKSLSCVLLVSTPWTAAHQAPPSMGFSRREYRSGLLSPSLIHWIMCHQNPYVEALTLSVNVFEDKAVKKVIKL